jgi:hypothetical protein
MFFRNISSLSSFIYELRSVLQLDVDAGALPTHQASQRGGEWTTGQAAQILKMLWDCCADLK